MFIKEIREEEQSESEGEGEKKRSTSSVSAYTRAHLRSSNYPVSLR